METSQDSFIFEGNFIRHLKKCSSETFVKYSLSKDKEKILGLFPKEQQKIQTKQ